MGLIYHWGPAIREIPVKPGAKSIAPRRIRREVRDEELQEDLERYRRMAIELGAADARIVHASDVRVDERVLLKCMIPRCYSYGESPNCPPYTPSPDLMRKALSKYKYAVFFKLDVKPVEDFAHPELWHKGHIRHYTKVFEIVGRIEARAFNDGYYLAMGFGAGTCKVALCQGMYCQFLDSGRCRYPLKARPSMEAVGIDVFDLATKVGWEVYPIGYKEVDPKLVPCAIACGIIFIY